MRRAQPARRIIVPNSLSGERRSRTTLARARRPGSAFVRDETSDDRDVLGGMHAVPLPAPMAVPRCACRSAPRSAALMRPAADAGITRFRGNVAFPFRAAPAHSSVLRGCPALFSYSRCPFRPGPCRIQSRTGRGLLKFLDPGPPEMGGDFLRAGESVIVLGRPAPLCYLLGTRAGVMLPLRRLPPASLSRQSGRTY